MSRMLAARVQGELEEPCTSAGDGAGGAPFDGVLLGCLVRISKNASILSV